mgnify:CR=1 FL=1
MAEEAVDYLEGPIIRVTTPHIPLPAAPSLEELAISSAKRVIEAARAVMQ